MHPNSAGRLVLVDPVRLPRWLDGLAANHGAVAVTTGPDRLILECPDGATATFELPWGQPTDGDPIAALVEQMMRERPIGALIVRRRAHAVGIFEGEKLLRGRHHSHYVQGRTKAGGWSQQRYARRRQNQASHSYEAAAADVEEILLPTVAGLAGLAVGGDRPAVVEVLSDRRFAALRELPRIIVDQVPDPNATVLREFGPQLRKVRIRLNELA